MTHEEEKALIAAVAQLQGQRRALDCILSELIMQLAQTQLDPKAFLKSMYERVSRRLDQTPLETEATFAQHEARLNLSSFFSVLIEFFDRKKAQ